MNTDELIAELRRRAADPRHATYMRSRETSLFPPEAMRKSPLAAPVTLDRIESAEAQLGYRLPHIYALVLLQVGNGGFGPGYGLLGLDEVTGDERDYSAIRLYQLWRAEDPSGDSEGWNYPSDQLPIAHWGCNIYSCMSLSATAAPVTRFYADAFEPSDDSLKFEQLFAPESESLESWLRSWLDGSLSFYLHEAV